MAIVTGAGSGWADLLDPTVKFKADAAFVRRQSMLPMLFNVQGSSGAREQISGVGAIGIDAWKNYENSGGITPEVDFDQGYKKTYTHKEYSLDFGIFRKDADDSNLAEAFRVAERIGDSGSLFRETEAASVFNNAFNSSFVGADAVALCSDLHPLSPQKTGVTQDNNFALALTKTNVRTIREAMMAFTDDNGNKRGITPNLLLVPPQLQDDAIEIVNSTLNPDTANNTVNPMFGRFQVMPWHYLTDSNAWFMIDSNEMRMSLDWFNRAPFSVARREGDDTTLKAYWRAYMRFSYGWSGWQWVAGSNPS